MDSLYEKTMGDFNFFPPFLYNIKIIFFYEST